MPIEIVRTTPLLSVFDMPTSLAFYRKLGFAVTQDSGQGDKSGWVLLELDGGRIMLNTQFEDDSRPETCDASSFFRRIMTPVSILAAPMSMRPTNTYAKTASTREPPEIAPYGMKQLYVSDPDNYNLCFQWPA